jgi:superfamily II DNA/RNA helicase
LPDDFNGLGLSAKVTDAVAAAGYTKPTDIQARAIPYVLERKDVIGIAQTGTGKTASFVLPMLTILESGRARARMPRTLILEPTRELAAQVAENFEKYGKNHKLTMALLIGGVSFEDQNRVLDRGADVLIATPGRMLDQFERGRILLTGVDILVIDEADRMLDMGFIPDIERICSLLPTRRQTLFFSATMAPEIEKLTRRFLHDPVKIEVAQENKVVQTITQRLVRVSGKPDEKRMALRALIHGEENLKNAIIFCNRKREAATLARSLQRHGFSADALHGDMDQKSRMETLSSFKTGKLALLIASDVAARGLDIPAVTHVFNFDVPTHAEDYIHRIGRTGRAGLSGTSITLATPSDGKYVDAIARLTGQKIPEAGLARAAIVAEEADEAPERDHRGHAPERDHAGPGSERGSRARGRRRNGKAAEPAPTRTPEPAPAKATPPRPAMARAPKPDRTPRDPPPGRGGRVEGIVADSPFGSDGPVPAFLLRPGRAD